jgi:aminoacyl tRNA synthase complex-interacting multifunctional protein 1
VFDMEKLKWVNSQHLKMVPMNEIVDLVKEQFELADMVKDGASTSDLSFVDFAFASTALAKQMMQVTKDPVDNAKTVLGYGLAGSLDQVADSDAKSMIERGNFYPLASRILADYDAGQFPLPDPANSMSAFQDSTPCEFTKTYQAYMKTLAKEMGVKGKNLFHPVRLMLSGEMSGQDVTKQLSLLTLAVTDDSAIDSEKAGIVTFGERMDRLRAFCETIPEEFRQPKEAPKKGSSAKGAASEGEGDPPSSAAQMVAAPVDPKDDFDGPPITALDIRVGKITKVWEHEEADKLYCEEIDVGEEEPRMVASGLRPYLKAEDMEGKLVLVLCNLKARKLVGFPSHGMVLCASNADHTEVRLVNPPVDAKIGERVTVPDFVFEGEEAKPFAENKIGKKKIFEKLAPHLVTSKYGVPEFLGRPFMTSAGVCTSPIADGTVS